MRCNRDCRGLASCSAQRLRIRASQRVRTSGAIVTKASQHCHTLLNRRADNRRLDLMALGANCVCIVAQTWKLALFSKSDSERVGLTLCIQKTLAVIRLECRYTAHLGLMFHNFLGLFPPQLGRGLDTTHFLRRTGGAVVIGCSKTCTARKRRFLLQWCPLCCPLGVDKGDGSVIQPRVR